MPRFLIMQKLSTEKQASGAGFAKRQVASQEIWHSVDAVEECAYYVVDEEWDQVGIVEAPSREVVLAVISPLLDEPGTARLHVLELKTPVEAEADGFARPAGFRRSGVISKT